jgi:hypothetical protein
MARPIKDNADYFSHDASMRDDPKIKALRRKFKHEGYSIWNMLLESITDADNFRFTIDFEIMGGDYDIEPELLKEIVLYCVNLGLLQYSAETSVIWSKTLDNRMATLLSKRKRNRNPADGELSTSETPQSKVKESKVYLSIGEQSEKYILVLAKYSSDKPKKIYSLRAHFEITGQIEAFNSVGFVHFEAFMTANTGKMFNDDSHLDNTFRNFCKDYKPPPSEPIKYENAEYNKSLWTTEAWEEFYSKRLLSDADFRKHFGYGELFVSKAVG